MWTHGAEISSDDHQLCRCLVDGGRKLCILTVWFTLVSIEVPRSLYVQEKPAKVEARSTVNLRVL